MHTVLHPRDDKDRQDVSRKRGRGRGLISIEDSADATTQGLQDDIKKSQEKLITVANNRTKITKKQKWEEKYWYFQCDEEI